MTTFAAAPALARPPTGDCQQQLWAARLAPTLCQQDLHAAVAALSSIRVNMAATLSLLCRLLWLSSVSYSDTTTLTLELATPPRVAPDGLLLCPARAGTAGAAFGGIANSVVVKSLQQGGGLFSSEGVEELLVAVSDASVGWQTVPFFQQRSALAQQLQPAELVDAGHVLGSDPYYSSNQAADGVLLPPQLAGLLHSASSSNASTACVLLSGETLSSLKS